MDTAGHVVRIPFYIFEGSGLLLIGNEIFHQSYSAGPKILFVARPRVGWLSQNKLSFLTYVKQRSSPDPDVVRKYLLVVLAKLSFLKSFFSFQKFSACSLEKETQFPWGTGAKMWRYGLQKNCIHTLASTSTTWYRSKSGQKSWILFFSRLRTQLLTTVLLASRQVDHCGRGKSHQSDLLQRTVIMRKWTSSSFTKWITTQSFMSQCAFCLFCYCTTNFDGYGVLRKSI